LLGGASMTNRRVASFLEHFTQQHIMNCSVCKKALYPTKQSFAYRCIQCPDFVLCQTCELECHEHHPVYHSFLILRKSLFGKKLSHFPNVSKGLYPVIGLSVRINFFFLSFSLNFVFKLYGFIFNLCYSFKTLSRSRNQNMILAVLNVR
jgi:hypothetical protein